MALGKQVCAATETEMNSGEFPNYEKNVGMNEKNSVRCSKLQNVIIGIVVDSWCRSGITS